MQEVEPRVGEGPILLPVVRVVDAMLPDVPSHGFEAVIIRGQVVEVKNTSKEIILGKPPAPIHLPQGHGVQDVPACNLRDALASPIGFQGRHDAKMLFDEMIGVSFQPSLSLFGG